MFKHIYAARRPLYLYVVCLLITIYSPLLWLKLLALVGQIGFLLDHIKRWEDSVLLEKIISMKSPCGIAKWNVINRRLRSSWCGRGVLETHVPIKKQHHYYRGYRWWHILPDGAPWVFLKKDFWKSSIGI